MTETITIERGIPMPIYGHGYFNHVAAALDMMNVGDSFTVETATKRQNVYSVANSLGYKVRALKSDGCYRIWLISKPSNPPAERKIE